MAPKVTPLSYGDSKTHERVTGRVASHGRTGSIHTLIGSLESSINNSAANSCSTDFFFEIFHLYRRVVGWMEPACTAPKNGLCTGSKPLMFCHQIVYISTNSRPDTRGQKRCIDLTANNESAVATEFYPLKSSWPSLIGFHTPDN